MKKSLFYIIVFFALQVFALAVAWVGNLLVNGAGSRFSVTWAIVMQMVFTLSCIVLFLWRRWTPFELQRTRQQKGGILVWAVVAALGTIIPSMWLQEQLTFLPDLASKEILSIIHHPLGYLVIGILAPLSEEVVFRGAILRELLGWFKERASRSSSLNPPSYASWIAICVSALFFAAAHMNPAQMPHAFLLGLLLGWLYWRSGSILPGVVVHVANNTVMFILARSYPYMDDLTIEQLLGGSQRHLFMAIGFSFCLLLPALFQLHERMPHRKRVG